MLGSQSLQPPQSGRSRYSKALPAVPGLAADSSLPPLPLEPPPKDLPRPARPSTAGPGQESPFSPLSAIASPISGASTPTSIKSKMTIPRRPVGGGAGQKLPGLPATPSPKPPTSAPAPAHAPAPAYLQAPKPSAPTTTTTTTTNPPNAMMPPPSPSDSLSSLLSAYSRSSIGSPVVSSEGTASFRDSQHALSPLQSDKAGATALLTASSTPITPVTFTPVPPPKETSIANVPYQQTCNLQTKPSLSPIPVESTPPPPPPAKDATASQQASSVQPQPSNSDLPAPSPSRPQLWRRRSVNKSKDLPPLAIHSSHGSTASTTPQVPPKNSEAETASVHTQSTTETIKPLPPVTSKPLPPAAGLPGRNVRPVQPSQQEPEASRDMRADSSKLRTLSDYPDSSGHSSGDHPKAKLESGVRPATGRPPTPEYQKEDVKTPVLDHFISPVSPASSPEPGRQSASSTTQQATPSTTRETHKQLPKINTGSITRKAVAPVPAPDLQAARSVPDLRSASPSVTTAPLPSLPSASSIAAANRSRRPSDAASARGRESADTSRFPPRGSSVAPDGRQKLVPSQSMPRNVSPEDDPRLVRSDSGHMLYRGRDGTLYPEMKESGEPDAKASYFPTHPNGRIPEGTILTAPPIRNSHFLCYQKHRNMGRRVNRQYPLTCQTCEKADVEDRWVCTFCQLRMCAPCLEKFNAKDRDLKQLVNSVKTPELPDVLSLSSGERPGSALGLQINF